MNAGKQDPMEPSDRSDTRGQKKPTSNCPPANGQRGLDAIERHLKADKPKSKGQ